MIKKKKQYIEIERFDWGFIKSGFALYVPTLIVDLIIGAYFIFCSFIPFLNIKPLGEYMEGNYNYPSFYKKVKYEVETSHNK